MLLGVSGMGLSRDGKLLTFMTLKGGTGSQSRSKISSL